MGETIGTAIQSRNGIVTAMGKLRKLLSSAFDNAFGHAQRNSDVEVNIESETVTRFCKNSGETEGQPIGRRLKQNNGN